MRARTTVNGSAVLGMVRFVTMNAVKARVQNGRMVLDEPTDLPDGAEVLLMPVDADELDDNERAALDRAIDRGLDDLDAGRVVSEEELWAELEKHRAP
jgi:hypothetical protein